jgi:hypothetical protein
MNPPQPPTPPKPRKKQEQSARRITRNTLLDQPPTLTFSARAWLKLLYLCHSVETEVGAFGISSADDLLYVEDILTVKQKCTIASVNFDDEAVADFFDEQVEAGRKPEQFARLWIHTHPGHSPEPSGLDEATFTRVFGRCNWAVMFILARGGATYCRLRVNGQSNGQGGMAQFNGVNLSSEIPVMVDHATLPEVLEELDIEAWRKELEANVQHEEDASLWHGLDPVERGYTLDLLDLDAFDIDASLLDELSELDDMSSADGSDQSLFDHVDEADREVDHAN